jgi:glycosyltransferase involved in cell wall biosynthesis
MGRKILVIAYYFPPLGLSGVQRTVKFVKYLPRYGWEPTVLTVRPGGYFAFDESLLEDVDTADVVRTRSLDPTRLFARSSSVRVPENWHRRLVDVITGTIFIPDNKIGWLPFARRTAGGLMRNHKFDAVLSTAPPYTGHLVGSWLARRFGVPFVADFRDDWLENPRHMYPSAWHRRLHARLERNVLAASSAVVTINDVIAERLRCRLPADSPANAVDVIEQGFDPDDFGTIEDPVPTSPDTFRFLYAGVFYDAQRPDAFLEGLSRAIQARPELRDRVHADFVGLVPKYFDSALARLKIEDMVTYHGYLPHDRVIQHIRSATVPWLTIGRRKGAESISTGKLFEYMGSRKPILGLVPEGAARDVLASYGAADIVDPDDVEGVSIAIRSLFDRFVEGSLPAPEEAFVARFDRCNLTGRLAEILHRVARPNAQPEPERTAR